MQGTVVAGSGTGKSFLALDGYFRQVREKLGFTPYLGTLNLKVERAVVEDLRDMRGTVLQGFHESTETYGSVYCFPASVAEIGGFVVLPEKSTYDDVIEFIAPKKMRDAAHLKNFDKVALAFRPFLTSSEKRRTVAYPHVGDGTGAITIYYDDPSKAGRRDICHIRHDDRKCTDMSGRESYVKTLPERRVVSYITERERDDAWHHLYEHLKERAYAVMSPPRSVRHRMLNEWLIEVKTTDC
jgi:hypothetical protein